MPQNLNLINVQSVSKSFPVGDQMVRVLKDINLQINAGDFTIIFGPSGCGKSTLLHTILGLEEPSAGTVSLFGKQIYNHSTEDERSTMRKSHFGMVYQQPNWVRSLTVADNVAFPLMLAGERRSEYRLQKAKEMLEIFNMASWANYTPSELSSGQQQLVALARALINDPEILVADEPTGNLDYESGQKLMQTLALLNKERKKTTLMVTHDLEYLHYAEIGVQMLDGKIIEIFEDGNKQDMISKIRSKRNLPENKDV